MDARFGVMAEKIDSGSTIAHNSFGLKAIHRERSKSAGVLGRSLIEKRQSLGPMPPFECHQISVAQRLRLVFRIGNLLGRLLEIALRVFEFARRGLEHSQRIEQGGQGSLLALG